MLSVGCPTGEAVGEATGDSPAASNSAVELGVAWATGVGDRLLISHKTTAAPKPTTTTSYAASGTWM